MKELKDKPVFIRSHGLLRVAVWKNENEDRKQTFYNTTLNVQYKDRKSNSYIETSQLTASQLPVASKLFDMAFEWITKQQ